MTDLPVPVEKLSRWQARSCERATLRGVNTMRSPDYIAFGVPTRRHRQHPSRRADTINSTDLITGFRKSSAVASPRFAACGPRLYVFCVCQRPSVSERCTSRRREFACLNLSGPKGALQIGVQF